MLTGQVRLGSSMMSLTQPTYQQPLLSILVKMKTQASLKTFQWLPETQTTKDRLLSEERKEEMHCKQESWGSGKLSRQKIPFFFKAFDLLYLFYRYFFVRQQRS